MTRKVQLSDCVGCRNDFYNGSDLGVTRCWSFEGAKLVMKKEVHVDQQPPWTQRARLLPNCYHRARYVYVSPDRKS